MAYLKRRTALKLLAGGIALPALRAADPKLRIAVNETTIESAPLFVGNFPEAEIVPVANGRIALAKLVSGEVDACTGSETQALLNSVAQPGLRIVLTLSECHYRIIARRSSGIKSMADLRGKKVAATVNTSSQYYLVDMLRTAKLAQKDVQFTNMEGPAMPAAIAKGEVDAIAMWEPHAENARTALAADAVVLQSGAVYFERFNLNTTTSVLNDPAKRRMLAKVIAGVKKISPDVQARGGDAMAKLSKAISTPEAVVNRIWGQFTFPADLKPGLTTLLSQVEPWAAELQNRKPQSSAILKSLIDSSLL